VWPILWVLACGGPSTTGPEGLVGQVLDPLWQPVSGLELSTDAQRRTTDRDGRFAIRFGTGPQEVGFRHAELDWTRRLRPEDHGAEVVVKLPRLARGVLVCELPERCEAELSWELDEGLVGRAVGLCEPGTRQPLVFVPSLPTRATCRTAETELTAVARVGAAELVLQTGAEVVRVEVLSLDGVDPVHCRVKVGPRVALPTGSSTGGGFYSAEARGEVTVRATCDGRPASPCTAIAGVDELVVLEWSATGPWVDPTDLPGAGSLILVREGEGGWLLQVGLSDDGLFPLPPLAAGRYRIGVGELPSVSTGHPGEPEPGILHLLPPDGATGLLVLDEDLTDGAIPVEVTR